MQTLVSDIRYYRKLKFMYFYVKHTEHPYKRLSLHFFQVHEERLHLPLLCDLIKSKEPGLVSGSESLQPRILQQEVLQVDMLVHGPRKDIEQK